MKKLIAILMTLAMVLALAACGSQTPAATDSTGNTSAEAGKPKWKRLLPTASLPKALSTFALTWVTCLLTTLVGKAAKMLPQNTAGARM